MRKLARFQFSFHLLEQILNLPEDVHIVKVYADTEHIHKPQWFWIMVEGEPFEEVREGMAVPQITPSVIDGFQEWEWNNGIL